MKKLWRKFDDLSEKCYLNMIGAGEGFEVWNEALEVLVNIISTGRETDPNYAKELIELDDVTDFGHDIGGWLEDYLDELEMRGMHDKLQEVCNKLLSLFRWKEDKPSDIRFRIAASLGKQGKVEESLDFCEKWYKDEKHNVLVITALIYAKIRVKDLAGAEELVKKYISEDTICTEDNDIIFTAASILYKANGNKKAEKRINKAIETYEEELEAFLMGMDDDDDLDFDWSDEELPFS